MAEFSPETSTTSSIASTAEAPISLLDQEIARALKHAENVITSDDPQIVKEHERVKNQRNEWDTWRVQERITAEQHRKLENVALIEARVNTIFDPLTELLNGTGLRMRLDDLISRTSRTHEQLSLLYIDLEGFKAVNDTLGHGEGDKILKKTAEFLRLITRGSDVVARVGGDEFIVAAVESRSLNRKNANGEKRESAQERLSREIQEGYESFIQDSYLLDGAGSSPHIGARVGVSTYLPGESQGDFISRGDADMNNKRDPNKPSR